MRQTFAEINLKALKHNYLELRKKLKSPKTKVMAVVKADAYGHGMEEVTKYFLSLSKPPEYFGVALIEEGIELCGFNVKNEILVFEPPVSKTTAAFYDYENLIPTVFEIEHLLLLKKYQKNKRRLKVHVKIDTGMGRLGVYYKNAVDFIIKLNSDKNFIIDGIFTHFATSDSKDKSFTNLQIKRFNEIIKRLKELNINYNIAHAANSGAIIQFEEAQFDMVRPGISLYGYAPSFFLEKSINLKPVMSIYSYVGSIRKFEEDETVGYSRLYKTKKNEQIFTVPFGYADGLSRNLSGKISVICKDKIFKQTGRINMDRISVSAGNNKLKTGDKVILIGNSKTKKLSAWDWCKQINSIPYETTCGISKRVPRIYIK